MEHILRDLTREYALLGLLFVKRAYLVRNIKTGGLLGHSIHKEIWFKISLDRRKNISKTSAVDMRRLQAAQ